MYNRPYLTEPDLFPHIGNERNTLIVTRIDIEGIKNQRVVLTVPVTKLRFFDDYTLVIRQPIPHMAQGLPLYIKAVEDKAFLPDVSAGFGHKVDDDADAGVIDANTGANYDGYGYKGTHCGTSYGEGYNEGCCDENVEVIKERIEAKIFPVTMAPFGNLAFGEDLTDSIHDEPRAFVCIYLNDQNEFVMRKIGKKGCRRPKKLVKVVEEITREPKMYEAIDRDIKVTPYGKPKSCFSHDYFLEGYGSGYGYYGGSYGENYGGNYYGGRGY